MQPIPNSSQIVLRSSAVSDRGLSEKRPHNEDSYLDMPQLGIFAVADGVGGAEAGEVASQMAVEILSEAFSHKASNSDAEIVMRVALERANAAIHQMSNDLSQLSKMATTIVALHIEGNIATIGHAGDSRVYRLQPDGVLVQETEDHSMVADEVRAGRMTEEQAENHPGKNIINRALGAEPNVEIDLKTIMIEPGSSFLLCSDGITRHVSDAEIGALLHAGQSTDDICEELKKRCFERGAEDNLTAVVVQTSMSGSVDSSAEVGAVAEHDNDILALFDREEDTVATARAANSPEDDLLEIETASLQMPDEPDFFEDPTISPNINFEETLKLEDTAPIEDRAEEPEHVATEPEGRQIEVPVAAPIADPVVATKPATYESEPLSMIQEEPSSLVRLAAYAAVLVLGSLIGLAVYHYALRQPAPPAPVTDQLTEMRSQNVALGAFEDNRRLVDSDPALYLSKNTDPRDAEDLYLVGRAQMLSGDFVKARASLTEARKRIAESDVKNRKVLESDIALALAVTNDTTIQSILKKELDSSKAANTNSQK